MRPTPPAGLDLTDALWAEVTAAYATAGRAYHALPHVLEVCRRADEVAAGPGWRRPREVFLAILFHDAVYVPGASDNEARSAELASATIARHLGGTGLDAAQVRALIELTARHGKLRAADVAADPDVAHFLDCDMAILAAAPADFAAYDRGVAAEYAFLPRDVYAAGRRRFLAGLLAAERIFLSEHFHARLDGAARENLRRALAA